ncbi:MAG: acetate--CoA ligase family protein [Alphaproteobacteria bacterium]|nr:acetate--CoA ligase family protein [Alphaproteobacteria bacterium]
MDRAVEANGRSGGAGATRPYRPEAEAMRALLAPASVAIVGASAQQGALGQRLLAHLVAGGYKGRIYPVNPRYQALQDLPCYPDLAALPERVDCAAFAVSDERVEAALAEAAAAGTRGAVVYGRLYEPPDRPGPSRPARLAAIARDAGMALCGANCMGFINTHAALVLSGNPPPLPSAPGRIAIVSHSGSTWSGLVGNQRDLHVTYAVSAGQELAGTIADYVDFLLDDPATRAIGLVVETIRDPDGFVAAAARARTRGVPIAALKLGRSELGRRFALAHSGALAGSAAVYEAWFEHLGIPVCTTLDQLMDVLELFCRARRPAAGGLGAATDSGAERQLVVDIAAEVGCPIAPLAPSTETRLAAILDPGMLTQNPVDVFGDGRMVLRECLDAIADDPGVGAVAMVTNLVHGRPYLATAVAAVESAAAATDKPVLVLGNLHSTVSRQAATSLRDRGIAVLMGTETGLRAIRDFLRWHQRRREERPDADAAPADIVSAWRARIRAGALDPADALALYHAFGGPVVPGAVAASEADSVAAAERLGFPVALKTGEPAIAHKTEAGGVALDLRHAADVATAYRRVAAACGPRVHLQKQVPAGVELFLGLVRDPQLGPALTIGFGGIFVEVLRDVVTVIPPVDDAQAEILLRRLRGFPLLAGARGRPPVDLVALRAAIVAFGRLGAALGDELAEFDLNPLICSESGVVAVDALAVARENP